MEISLPEWIIEADITTMQTAMGEGLISSEDLVKVYIERMNERKSP